MLSPVLNGPAFHTNGDRANTLGFGQTSFVPLPEYAEPNTFLGASAPSQSIPATPRVLTPGHQFVALHTRIAGAPLRRPTLDRRPIWERRRNTITPRLFTFGIHGTHAGAFANATGEEA